MSILLKNVHLLDRPEDERSDVKVDGGRIAAICAAGEGAADGWEADEVLDCSSKTLMPGLINCHTHAYMSLMRNYADDVPFETWLFDRITPIEDSLTADDAYWGNLLSIMEMIRTGTTTFVDMQMFPRMAVQACADSGMRALISRGLVGQSRSDEAAKRRLDEAFDEMEYGKTIGALCDFALGPHAIYTCGEDLLSYVADLAAEKGMRVNIHLAETEHEFRSCIAEHGLTPTAYLEKLGLLDREILLAHCVYLADEDYALLARPNVHVVTNPASNLKLANGFAPVHRMLKEGLQVAIGTDSAASNNALNLFTEMRLLTMGQKGVTKDALALTAEETLEIATANGARAIGRDDLGRVEEGRTADLVLIDENAPTMRPLYNRKAALAYSASGYEVSDVLIEGEFVYRDGEYTTIDAERVLFETEKIAERYR